MRRSRSRERGEELSQGVPVGDRVEACVFGADGVREGRPVRSGCRRGVHGVGVVGMPGVRCEGQVFLGGVAVRGEFL